MTPIEKKLASLLLNLAADEFSNHGCNDFSLIKEGGLTAEEAKTVQEDLVKDGASDELYDSEYSFDWMLMRWLAKKVQE